jgi:Carboxypeptidase regulatory-like domain
MHMRIFTPIAVSVGILLGAAPDIRAGQSPAASQEATCSITGRVTIENEGAPGIAVTLQPATSSFPLPPPVARATTDKDGRFQMNNLPDGRYYLVPLAPAYFAPSEDRMIASGKPITLMKGETLDGIELKLIPV